MSLSERLPGWANKFFGEPWPSGICEEGTRVDTPVGMHCVLCSERIEADDRGSFMGTTDITFVNTYGPVHRECSLRGVLGGIGHHLNHAYWCGEMHDPDGGHTYRESALLVWQRVVEEGILGPRRSEL